MRAAYRVHRKIGYDQASNLSSARRAVKLSLSLNRFWPVLLGSLLCAAAHAQPVSHLQVRVVTGGQDLSAGSVLELRIYEAGKAVRRLPLTHGESWPRDSTRVIPLTLSDALDPRNVLRFSLYYRAASPLTPPWEVVAADVDLSAGHGPPQLLLNTTLSGEIERQGELATLERDVSTMTCVTDADCDDQRSCNGHERCAPRTAGADARGCVRGSPVVCPVNQVCSEGRGCIGADSAKTLRAAEVDAARELALRALGPAIRASAARRVPAVPAGRAWSALRPRR